MGTSKEIKREAMTKPELQASERADKAASEFVYSVHSWRGRSPEFMQAQKRKLAELIDQTCHLRELEAVVSAARKARAAIGGLKNQCDEIEWLGWRDLPGALTCLIKTIDTLDAAKKK